MRPPLEDGGRLNLLEMARFFELHHDQNEPAAIEAASQMRGLTRWPGWVVLVEPSWVSKNPGFALLNPGYCTLCSVVKDFDLQAPLTNSRNNSDAPLQKISTPIHSKINADKRKKTVIPLSPKYLSTLSAKR